MRATTLLAVLLLWAALSGSSWAQQQTPLTDDSWTRPMRVGERVEFALDPTPLAKLVSREMAPVVELPPFDANGESLDRTKIPSQLNAKDERFTASLLATSAGPTLLLQNGYAYPVFYRATWTGRSGQGIFARTTNPCTIGAKETWAARLDNSVDGAFVNDVRRVDAQHLDCTAAFSPPPRKLAPGETVICTSDEPHKPSALDVELVVDGSGTIQRSFAALLMMKAFYKNEPTLMLGYVIDGDVAQPSPRGLAISIALSDNPPPTAKTATIVVSLDGVEAVRRPWPGYKVSTSSRSKNDILYLHTFRPVVLMLDKAGHSDVPGLEGLLRAFAESGHTVGVTVLGDDGSVIAHASYAVDPTGVHDAAILGPLLAKARERAKTPLTCASSMGL